MPYRITIDGEEVPPGKLLKIRFLEDHGGHVCGDEFWTTEHEALRLADAGVAVLIE
jgi:hypothetical protein